MSIVSIPMIGNVQKHYLTVLDLCKNDIVSNLTGYHTSVQDLIFPNTNIFDKWFNQDLPLRDVKVVFFVTNFLSPREFHLKKISKIITGRENQLNEQDLINKGILILPFEYIEPVPSQGNERITNDIQEINNHLNARLLGFIGISNPRQRSPIVILEENYSSIYNRDAILSLYRIFSIEPVIEDWMDMGKYIDNEIPYTEIPIKLNTLYVLDSSEKKREPKVINQFISHICHKL